MKYLNSATVTGEWIVQPAQGPLRMLYDSGQLPVAMEELTHCDHYSGSSNMHLLHRTICDLLFLFCVLVYAFLYLRTQTWEFTEHIEFQS